MSDLPSTPQLPPALDATSDSAILYVLMETIPDRIYFKDLQSRIVRNNAAQARFLGASSPAECVGKTDFDFFSREHAERARADELEIIRTGIPVVGKAEHITLRDGSIGWASTTKMPWRDASGRIIGTFGLTRDITEARLAEDRLREERNLLRTIIDHLPARIYVKDLASRYILNNLAHLALLHVKAQNDALGRTTLDFFPGERGQQALADDRQVMSSGVSIINQEKSDFGTGDGVRWSLTTKVPLHGLDGRISGLVGISHDITDRKRTELELEQRTREMEADLRMARQIQEVFLPRTYPVFPRNAPPQQSTLRFAHRYVSATSLGGDFFDIIRLSDSQCGVLICDVMGHGVRAGLLTALIRGIVGEMGPRAQDPSYVVGEINHCLTPILAQTGQPVFATAFYAIVNVATGTVSYSNAGHPAPFLLRCASGRVDTLATDDPEPAAGLIERFSYSRKESAFNPGDMLVVYTDGVFEAANEAGSLFGAPRLRELLAGNSSQPCASIPDRIVSEVEAFTGRADFDDDLCILVVQSTGAKPAGLPSAYGI